MIEPYILVESYSTTRRETDLLCPSCGKSFPMANATGLKAGSLCPDCPDDSTIPRGTKCSSCGSEHLTIAAVQEGDESFHGFRCVDCGKKWRCLCALEEEENAG